MPENGGKKRKAEIMEAPRRSSLGGFVVDRVLRHDVWGRTTSLLGHFESSPDGAPLAPPEPGAKRSRAIVILKQEPWPLAEISSIGAATTDAEGETPPALLEHLSAPGALELTMANDAYSYYKTADSITPPLPPPPLPSMAALLAAVAAVAAAWAG